MVLFGIVSIAALNLIHGTHYGITYPFSTQYERNEKYYNWRWITNSLKTDIYLKYKDYPNAKIMNDRKNKYFDEWLKNYRLVIFHCLMKITQKGKTR